MFPVCIGTDGGGKKNIGEVSAWEGRCCGEGVDETCWDYVSRWVVSVRCKGVVAGCACVGVVAV